MVANVTVRTANELLDTDCVLMEVDVVPITTVTTTDFLHLTVFSEPIRDSLAIRSIVIPRENTQKICLPTLISNRIVLKE